MFERVAYLLLIDGIPWAFTTAEDVDDAYVQTLGFDFAHPGLVPPDSLAVSIELRTGMPDGTSGRIEIRDCDADLPLPEMFGASEWEPLLTSVAAGTTATGASLYDKHIGTEKIGAAGQRRRHSCVPGWNVGLEHMAADQAGATGLEPSPVSDDPVIWAGRRFCLYRLEEVDGAWPDLTDEDTRRACRLYFGTLTGQGEPVDRVWSFSIAGPESWAMKSIGAGFSQVPIEVEVGVTLDESLNEHVLIGTLDITDPTDPEGSVQHTYVEFNDVEDDTLLSGAASYADVAAAMDDLLDVLKTFNANVTALVDEDGGDTSSNLRYSTDDGNDGIMVQWDRDAFGALGEQYSLRVRIFAHYKVWKLLGYDPLTQNTSVDPVENGDKFGLFERPSAWNTQTAYLGQWAIDYPSHWLGTFYAADGVAMKKALEGFQSSGDHNSSNGFERRWPPIYPYGTNTFDFNAVGQLFRVKSADPLFLASSSAVPLPADPDDTSSPFALPDVGDVTHQGIVVFEGPFRDETDPEAEVTKIMLPARVAWKQTSEGNVDTDGAWPKLVIYDWPEPRLYGFEDKRPTLWSAWRVPPNDGEPLTMRSVLVLEHGTGPDVAAYVLARLLATTGAVGAWSGYGLGSDATLTVGPNDLTLPGYGAEMLGQYTDADASTYGLGIPAEMISIDADAVASLEAAIEEHAEADVYRCKTVLGKIASARDVVASLLAPFGWAMSFAGGRFGLFDPYTFHAPNLDEGVITEESIAGTAGEPRSSLPRQRLRIWAPIDRIKLQARLNPVTGDYAREEVLRSPDPGQLYRAQSIEHGVDGSHLIHPTLLNVPGSSWITSLIERWRKAAGFWNKQHFEVTQTVPLWRHAEFWPGAPVTISSEWLVNPAGQVYGIVQAPGYVISRTVNCQARTMNIRCIVDASALRLYGPAAKVTRYVENESGEGYRLLCEDDYLSIRGNTGTLDVEGFVEPAFSTAGGDATIEVIAYNATSFSGGIYGTVDSVNAEPGNCFIQLTGPLTGADWLRDHHHIVVIRNALDQEAPWPYAVLAPIGDKDGDYAADMKSPKFKD